MRFVREIPACRLILWHFAHSADTYHLAHLHGTGFLANANLRDHRPAGLDAAVVDAHLCIGVEVVVPREQKCCGALAAHTGADWQAKKFARHNLTAFPQDVDAVLTNAAGCGSGMQEYALWLKGTADEAAAQQFVSRVKDVSLFLADLGLLGPTALPAPLKVAYHDACHLAHAQRVTAQPRTLLRQIENLELLEIPSGEICCGSAGTYNIEQPQTAKQLGQSKADAILSTGAEAVATGNIGCLVQIETYLRSRERPLPVWHTMQLLDQAYGQAATGIQARRASE